MAKKARDPERLEPYILRLQLELALTRAQAAACVRAGFVSHAQIAAADDEAFVAAVALRPEDAAAVLAVARAPGSKAPQAGPAPQLARETRASDVVAKAVRPVRERAAKISRRPEAPVVKKPAETPDTKRRRAQADALEAELDDALRGPD